MTLACEVANSKLVQVVAVADVDDIMHLTTMPMEKSPGRGHKQGGGDDQERQGGGHQCHQAGY